MSDKVFTYSNQYDEYPDCVIQGGRDGYGNRTGRLLSKSDGPIFTITASVEEQLYPDQIAVKNYCENDGVDDWLVAQGLVDPYPVRHVRSGWTNIPVYNLTPEGLEVFAY